MGTPQRLKVNTWWAGFARGEIPVYRQPVPVNRLRLLPLSPFSASLLSALVLLGVLSRTTDVAAQAPAVPVTQEDIVTHLRSDKIAVLSLGISGVSRTPHQEWTPDVREAIVFALAMEIQRDLEAARLGVHRFSDGNLVAPLARLAVVTKDPAAIPSLVRMTGMGSVRAALASFGRLALPELIRVVREEEFGVAYKCLIVLRQMVEEKGQSYFNEAERAQLKALVAGFLASDRPMIRAEWDPEFKSIIVKHAAYLALVLHDVEARSWVTTLAQSTENLKARAGTDVPEYHLAFLQAALRGEPLLPLSVPLSDYLQSWRKRERYGQVYQPK